MEAPQVSIKNHGLIDFYVTGWSTWIWNEEIHNKQHEEPQCIELNQDVFQQLSVTSHFQWTPNPSNYLSCTSSSVSQEFTSTNHLAMTDVWNTEKKINL